MADTKTTKFKVEYDLPTERLLTMAKEYGYQAKQPNPHFKNGVSPDSEREIKNPITPVQFAIRILQGKSMETSIANLINPLKGSGDHTPNQITAMENDLRANLQKQVFGE